MKRWLYLICTFHSNLKRKNMIITAKNRIVLFLLWSLLFKGTKKVRWDYLAFYGTVGMNPYSNNIAWITFFLGFTSARYLSAVLSNSSFVITSRNFSHSSLTLWYCAATCLGYDAHSHLPLHLCIPMFCAWPKTGVHQELVHVFFEKYFLLEIILWNFQTPCTMIWQCLFLLLSKIVFLKLVYRALDKYENIQIYDREALVHQKLHHIVSRNYLI